MSPSPTENLHYLAKDYSSFRSLMIDHLALHAPAISMKDAASVEVALVEVLAYVADYLSYFQDAVATEAYLGTARERSSVARHSRLLDYRLNEGCSARTWAHFEVAAATVELRRGTVLTTDDGEAFETVHDTVLRHRHNRMEPVAEPKPGDTSARLAGALPELSKGDVLILRQQNASWSHALRIVRATVDEFGGSTRIDWHVEDELPDDVPASGGGWSMLGNIVLADHGRWVRERLGSNPDYKRELVIECDDLAYSCPYDPMVEATRSASSARVQDPRRAEPCIELEEVLAYKEAGVVLAGATWTGRRDIIRATRFDRCFTAEPGDDGSVRLRFGDGTFGRKPGGPWKYRVAYRSGGGSRGNIAAGALIHMSPEMHGITAVTNPIAAWGGEDRESTDEAKERASTAEPEQERCVTEADYRRRISALVQVEDSIVERRPAADGAEVVVRFPRSEEGRQTPGISSRLSEGLAPLAMIGDELRLFDPESER